MREEVSIEQIKRSYCWLRLKALHDALPNQYQDPQHLYCQFKWDQEL